MLSDGDDLQGHCHQLLAHTYKLQVLSATPVTVSIVNVWERWLVGVGVVGGLSQSHIGLALLLL